MSLPVMLATGAAIFRIKVAEGIQYRAAMLSNTMVGMFWGFIEVTVYRVFYTYAGNSTAVNTAAYTLPQLISYLWLVQILLILSPHNVEGEILDKINNGDIGVELCRPLDLYLHWFMKTAAGKIAPLVWRGFPILLVALILPDGWRLTGPASVAGFLLMLVSCLLALVLCTAYGTMVATVRMSVRWGDGPMYMILLAGTVFSGAYLPLQLWPDALQRILLYQPFAGYMDIPLRLYLGTIAPQNAAPAMLLQIGWTLVFIIIGRLIMMSRLRKTVIQGG